MAKLLSFWRSLGGNAMNECGLWEEEPINLVSADLKSPHVTMEDKLGTSGEGQILQIWSKFVVSTRFNR